MQHPNVYHGWSDISQHARHSPPSIVLLSKSLLLPAHEEVEVELKTDNRVQDVVDTAPQYFGHPRHVNPYIAEQQRDSSASEVGAAVAKFVSVCNRGTPGSSASTGTSDVSK